MQDIELSAIWKQYDEKLDQARLLNLQSWALNLQSFEMHQKFKAKSTLGKLANYKMVLVVFGIAWVMFLGFLILHSLVWSKIFFVVSVSAIAIITLIAVWVYIRQVMLLNEISNTESVVKAQEKLSRLQNGTIRVTRILFLQSPFYCSWFLTADMIQKNPQAFWLITVPIFCLFAIVSVWLYFNIHIKNAHKKWFRVLFSSREWTDLLDAQAFYNEIENFKKELDVK
jgi:hypothetical protein